MHTNAVDVRVRHLGHVHQTLSQRIYIVFPVRGFLKLLPCFRVRLVTFYHGHQTTINSLWITGSNCIGIVEKVAAQDAGLSEEKRLMKWVCKVFKELWLNKIENSEN